MTKRGPIASQADFEALMNEVDQALQDEHVAIPGRQLRAIGEVSRLLGIELRVAPLSTGPIPGNYAGDSLTAHILQWMQQRYGDRLKMNMGLGSSVIRIRGDAWLVRFPVVYGTVTLVCDRNLARHYPNMTVNRPGTPRQETYVNILKLVENLPPTLASKLSDDELQAFLDRFVLCYTFLNSVHSNVRDSELPFLAIADLQTSARYIVESREEGLSRWSSLQAAEKVLKYFIEHKRATFPKTHNLWGLSEVASQLGLPALPREYIQAVQCEASARYEAGSKDFTQALRAHENAVDIGSVVMRTLFPD